MCQISFWLKRFHFFDPKGPKAGTYQGRMQDFSRPCHNSKTDEDYFLRRKPHGRTLGCVL